MLNHQRSWLLWIIDRDPSWYSTDYWVYMGSSMTVRPLTGCHCTCALVNWLVLLHLSLASIMVIVRGSWPFSGGEPKGTLVDCSWLVWSSSCVGCAAPYLGFGVWCQLARESPSEWITTTRSSLPASKWTSVKNHCVHHLIPRWLVFIDIDSCDWLVHSSTRRYNYLALSLYLTAN